MSEAPTLPASPLSPERQLVEAARIIVAALTDAPSFAKRLRKLERIAEKAEALRPADLEPSNVVPLRGVRPGSPSASDRTRAALSALIAQAVEAERLAMAQAVCSGGRRDA